MSGAEFLHAVGQPVEPERRTLREVIAKARRDGWEPKAIALVEEVLLKYERQRRWQVKTS